MFDKNNDPIKEYGKFSLGNLFKDIFEINEYYDPNLHNCSDDLSDFGSRKEEYNHAQFAKKIEKMQSDAISEKMTYKVTSQNFGIILFLILLGVFSISILGSIAKAVITEIPFFEIFNNLNQNENFEYESSYNSYDDYNVQNSYDDYNDQNNYDEYYDYEGYYNVNTNQDSENYEDYYDDYYYENYIEEDLLDYSQIEINNFRLNQERSFIEIVNKSQDTYTDLEIQIKFFDNNDDIVVVKKIPIGVLLGNNTQYVEIIDAPIDYSYSMFEIIETKYTKIKYFDNIDLELEVVDIDGKIKQFRITNSTNEIVEDVELMLLYIKEGMIVEAQKIDFPPVNIGEETVLNYTLELEKYDSDSFVVTINDLYVY